MDRRDGRKGGRRRRPPGSLVLLIALLLGLGTLVLATDAGSPLAWAVCAVMAAAFIAVYRLSRRGDLWRTIEDRTGMGRTEVSSLTSACLAVGIVIGALQPADWLYPPMLLVALPVATLLWTYGPRDAFRSAVALPVMLRIGPLVAVLVAAGLLGAPWWLLLALMVAGVLAVDRLGALRRGRAV
jgi:hypothetical protein